MFLGVDGGGTKTAFSLLDSEGQILALHHEAGSYYLEVGVEGAAAVLKNGTAATLAAAGATMDSIRFAFFGLPAYGEDSALQDALDALPLSFLDAGRYRCGNDMICGWAGSLACQDGISIVAGTGSIAYGEYGGREARAGGWGELFSDEGSAYWIAREGLRLFSRMSDGRTGKGLLHALFRERFAIESDLDLCAAVYGKMSCERSALAQLAKLVFAAANGGDEQARAIFVAGARELSEIVNAVRRTLLVPAEVPLPVSYSGGVFNSPSLVLEPFREALATSASAYLLTSPMYPPVIGAALYAAKCCRAKLGTEALASLAKQCQSTSASEWSDS